MADNSFTHLLVVGSPAGGIGALSGLVSSLRDDFDAPIVVAQHPDPNRESHLQEILAQEPATCKDHAMALRGVCSLSAR